jgi:hypothetical protein
LFAVGETATRSPTGYTESERSLQLVEQLAKVNQPKSASQSQAECFLKKVIIGIKLLFMELDKKKKSDKLINKGMFKRKK